MAFNYYQYGSVIGKNQKYKASGMHNLISAFGDFGALYDFTTFTFTSGTPTATTATGESRSGPLLSTMKTLYNTTTNPWVDDINFFDVVNGIQRWTVPATGTYSIDAYGAQGRNSASSQAGGLGARIQGNFELVAGDVLQILVGQIGGSTRTASGGGGGGTFVVRYTGVTNTVSDILVIAGGGGGGADGSGTLLTGVGGVTTTNGTAGQDGLRAGGSNGDGGLGDNGGWGGAGGGGFSGTGGLARQSNTTIANSGGFSFLSGGLGGVGGTSYTGDGGFGGGGGSSWGAGGGGGYSGGGADNSAGSSSDKNGGGGGGSYNTGTSKVEIASTNTGSGKVIITRL